MNHSHTQIANDLFISTQSLTRATPAVTIPSATDHVLVIDVSGSMYHPLGQIRLQLKNKLVTMVGDQDTVSIVWYSGRNEFGVLIEAFPVKSAKDLMDLNRAIDRFLQPRGLTGFVQPLQEVAALIRRRAASRSAGVSLMFLSDGYDNQWRESEILDAAHALEDLVESATIIEYGYYANKQLLAKMAETIGGSLIHATDFSSYDPIFENHIRKRTQGGKKVEVQLEVKPLYGLAYTVQDGDVIVFQVDEKNTVRVPESVTDIHYLSATKVGKAESAETPVYAAIYLMSQRMKSNEVLKLLTYTGDVRLIKKFTNAFGKQALADFQAVSLATVKDPALRLTEGYDPKLVPAEDAYTVIDLLFDLSVDDGNKFYPRHESFQYKRIGRARIATGSMLTESETTEIEQMMTKARTTRDLERAQDRLEAIMDAKSTDLQFTYGASEGYPISSLTFNEERPNVSVLVQMAGTVDLTKALAANPILTEKLKPDELLAFPTKVYRNYAIIRDGLVNVDILPVSLTEETHELLRTKGVVQAEFDPTWIYQIDLRALPVINRRMVNEVSAVTLFKRSFELLQAKAAQKVYKFYREALYGKKTSTGYVDAYGVEATKALTELGFSEYNGFSPKGVLAEAQDVYQAVNLAVKLAGLSSLPSVNDVQKALDAKKTLTISQSLMAPVMFAYKGFMESKVFEKLPGAAGDDLKKKWLEERTKESIGEARKIIRELAQIKFSVVLGRVWFQEFESIDDNTMEIDFLGDGKKIKASVILEDVEEKI